MLSFDCSQYLLMAQAVAKQLGLFKIGANKQQEDKAEQSPQFVHSLRKRGAVAAEGTADATTVTITCVPKSDATLRLLGEPYHYLTCMSIRQIILQKTRLHITYQKALQVSCVGDRTCPGLMAPSLE